MKDHLSKAEIRKDAVQGAVRGRGHHGRARSPRSSTTAVKDVARSVGGVRHRGLRDPRLRPQASDGRDEA